MVFTINDLFQLRPSMQAAWCPRQLSSTTTSAENDVTSTTSSSGSVLDAVAVSTTTESVRSGRKETRRAVPDVKDDCEMQRTRMEWRQRR